MKISLSRSLVVSLCLCGHLSAQIEVDHFTEEAVDRGLVYSMCSYPQPYGYVGFGCGFADLDNDGDQDVILLGAADHHTGLFENDGSGQFADRSAGSGLPDLDEVSDLAAGDYNGDGLIDLYFTQIAVANVLMRNNGNFQFTDVTAEAGVSDLGASKGASWGDLDNDGFLDLYVANYNGAAKGTEDLDNVLYHNLGDGTFENVSVEQTVDDLGYGFCSVWFDYDRDGDLDLYLANDRGHQAPLFAPNQLWRNDNGQMVNVSDESGTGLGLFAMSVGCADFDGNGWADLYCTNNPGGGGMNNPLMLNQGDGTFIEFSMQAGVDNPYTSWGSIFADFDNNGHSDLYVNNQFVPNTLYMNYGTFPCPEQAATFHVRGSTGISFASAVADVDSDGDIDLLLNNLDGNVQLFINKEGEKRNWIRYQVIGLPPNHWAIGANVDTRFGETWRFGEVFAGGNTYVGQNESIVHIGADNALTADEVVVSFPGGRTTRTLTSMPVDQLWKLYHPDLLGDANQDGVVDLLDLETLSACYNSTIEPGCEIVDFDGNSFIDQADYEAFAGLYGGALYDCNHNKQDDLLDIVITPGIDADGTGIPDSCEANGDLDGDGVVGITDLLTVLSVWGPCPDPPEACPADHDDDGHVGITDLLNLLAQWG